MQLRDMQGPGYNDLEHSANAEGHAQDVLPRRNCDKSREPLIQRSSSLQSLIFPTNNVQLSNTGVCVRYLTSRVGIVPECAKC